MIGAHIRRRREIAGIGLRELARMTDISAAHLSHVETAGHAISAVYALRIACALGCTVEDLFGEETDAIREDVSRRSETAKWTRTRQQEHLAELRAENERLKILVAQLRPTA